MSLNFFKKHKWFIIFLTVAAITAVGIPIYVHNFNKSLEELNKETVAIRRPKKAPPEPQKEPEKKPITKTIPKKKSLDQPKEEPITDPVFELPITNINDVTGIQVFHDPGSSELHTGFDFKLPNPTQIFAPISGTVSDVHKFQMSNGYWVVDVVIQINLKFSTFIAFEPWTQSEAVIDQQMSKIVVKKGDIVKQGQLLGILDPVLNSEFPHIHWQVQTDHTPLSPYDYCSANAKAQIDILCNKFGKQPAY